MWPTSAGWEARVFIPLPSALGQSSLADAAIQQQSKQPEGGDEQAMPTAAVEDEDGVEDLCADFPSVWEWVKQCKQQRKQLKAREPSKKRKNKGKSKIKEGKKANAKKGQVERRTDYYFHLSPSGFAHYAGRLTPSADENEGSSTPPEGLAEHDALWKVEQWMERNCGLKLRGIASGYQLELKVCTSASVEQQERSDHTAERWVKVSLPPVERRDNSDEADGRQADSTQITLPPRTAADIVALHRILGDHVGQHSTSAGMTTRGVLMEAASLLGLRRIGDDDDEEYVRKQVGMAQETIRRRLLLACESLGSTSQDSPATDRGDSQSLCGVWRTDKARRQRNIRWWPPGKIKKGEGIDLVVEQTYIKTFTYVPSADVSGATLEEVPLKRFISICAEGCSAETLHQFITGFLGWLPVQWQDVAIVGSYPSWIARLAHERAESRGCQSSWGEAYCSLREK